MRESFLGGNGKWIFPGWGQLLFGGGMTVRLFWSKYGDFFPNSGHVLFQIFPKSGQLNFENCPKTGQLKMESTLCW